MRAWLGWAAMAAVVVTAVGCDETTIDGAEQGRNNGAVPADETCEVQGDEQECGGEGSVQYCDEIEGELKWGPCLSTTECEPGETLSCGLGEEFGDLSRMCLLEEGIPVWDPYACNTPLVLAFEPGPVPMSAAATASFDISGAGECITTDWPTAATPWLAIDLDRSGTIDGGHELLGSGTILASGRHARHGFAALAELDSNGDGRISALDARFGELVLWTDLDGDRQSTLWELEPLRWRGVESIELDFATGQDCDARGNCARERSRFSFAAGSGVRSGEVIDLYLACQ